MTRGLSVGRTLFARTNETSQNTEGGLTVAILESDGGQEEYQLREPTHSPDFDGFIYGDEDVLPDQVTVYPHYGNSFEDGHTG